MYNLHMILQNRSFLWMLLVINILGTIYGYVWYGSQLEVTPWYFIPFVPDSPTASLFFVFVLLAFLARKNWPLMEALAAVSLFKYGIWAVAMNLAGGYVTGSLTFTNYMLMFSHFGMAMEGLLYSPFYRIRRWHLYVAALWVFHNEIIDYVFGQMPYYPVLDPWFREIAYFTFWLSVCSVALIYWLTVKAKREAV